MNTETSSVSAVTRGPRQSNFELLRIVAMFMVLMLHANFAASGVVEDVDFRDAPLTAWTRLGWEMLCIPAVNVFVMISGWFGIKRSLRGGLSFVWQWIYFVAVVWIILSVSGLSSPSVKQVADSLGAYWFVTAYAGFYLLTPIFNTYLAHTPTRQLGLTAALLSALSAACWIAGYSFIGYGQSIGFFIVLYILSAYLRRHPGWWRYGLPLYLAATVLGCVVYPLCEPHFAIAYSNPLVMAQSAGMIMWFAGMRMGVSKLINRVAASAFAAYLLHMHLGVMGNYYLPWARQINREMEFPSNILLLIAYCGAWFVAAILLDQPRRWLWSPVQRRGRSSTLRKEAR